MPSPQALATREFALTARYQGRSGNNLFHRPDRAPWLSRCFGSYDPVEKLCLIGIVEAEFVIASRKDPICSNGASARCCEQRLWTPIHRHINLPNTPIIGVP